MKNPYIIAGVIVVLAIFGFVFWGKKTEAPLNQENNQNDKGIFLEDGQYEINRELSKIYWEGEYLTGLKEKGSLSLLSGQFYVSSSTITQGEFIIDMNSISSDPENEGLVNHLRSSDFFDVEKYPVATFILKKIMPTSEGGAKLGRYVFAGDLIIKGITQPISFVATISSGKNSAEAKASFALNRADWEIKYNSPSFFSDLGDKIIRDAFVVELDFVANKVIQ